MWTRVNEREKKKPKSERKISTFWTYANEEYVYHNVWRQDHLIKPYTQHTQIRLNAIFDDLVRAHCTYIWLYSKIWKTENSLMFKWIETDDNAHRRYLLFLFFVRYLKKKNFINMIQQREKSKGKIVWVVLSVEPRAFIVGNNDVAFGNFSVKFPFRSFFGSKVYKH